MVVVVNGRTRGGELAAGAARLQGPARLGRGWSVRSASTTIAPTSGCSLLSRGRGAWCRASRVWGGGAVHWPVRVVAMLRFRVPGDGHQVRVGVVDLQG
jgi:hypothetical protein